MVVLRPLLLARLARQGRAVATALPQATYTSLARWPQVSSGVRAFSSKGLNGVNGAHHDDEWEDDAPLNGDVSPFERLLQHSQQFREEVGMDDLTEDVEDTDDERPHGDGDESDERKHDVDDDLEAVLDEREGDHAEFMGQIRKPQAHHYRLSVANKRERTRHHAHARGNKFSQRWGVEQRVRRQIGNAEDVDFEHGLRDLDERRAREKMYTQLLTREYDRDRVCQNCGEPGHVAANCMLPTICSNCGDVGHRRHECPHRSFDVDQLAAIKPKGKSKKTEAETRRRIELQAIRERHERMKKAFDDELDEYLEFYENQQTTRKQIAQKTSEEED